MKKVTSILMAFVLMLTLIPTAWAEGESVKEWTATDSLPEYGTYKLMNDVTLSSTHVVKGELNLDLNGKTVKNENDLWDGRPGDWSLISVRGSGSLTITGNGTLHAKENDCYAIDVQDVGATVTIQGGVYEGNIHAVYVYEGKANIQGGTYSVQQKFSATQPDQFVLNLYDKSRVEGKATIVVTGGTFLKFNPADCEAEGKGTNFVHADYKSVKGDGDTYTVVPKDYVAQIGEIKYETLADAIKNVGENQTITMIADVKNAAGMTVDTKKTFTVDFAGHTYTVNKPGAGSKGTETSAFQLLKGQTITFKNGTIDISAENLTPAVAPAGNIKRIIQCYAGLTLENMKIDGTNMYSNDYPLTFNHQPVFITGNTSVICKEGTKIAFDADGNWGGYDRCKVTVDTTGTIGGDIELGNGYLDIKNVTAHGIVLSKDGDAARATVTGGTFNTNPKDYVPAAGYTVAKAANGLYTVSTKTVKEDGTGETTSAVKLEVPATSDTVINTPIDKNDIETNKELTVTNNKTAVTINQAGVAAIGTGADLNLSIKADSKTPESANTAAYNKAMAGKDANSAVVVNVSLTNGASNVFATDVPGAYALVTVPYTTDKADKLTVYYLNGSDATALTKVADAAAPGAALNTFSYDAVNKLITLKLPHFSEYLISTTATRSVVHHYGGTGTTTTTGTKTNSPTTFDAGVGIYAVSAILSVTGMAWVGTKQRKH